MKIIYEPKGRALEYSFLALNPWGKSWCSHDCSYCFVPGTFRMSRERWRAQPFAPCKDLLKKLRLDCAELRGTDKRVLCCFAGDLYSPEANATGLPRLILETFREFDVPFQVLTKGGTWAVYDFDLYGPNDAFATTMTFTNNNDSHKAEPGAATPNDRIKAMKTAHDRGIETWVSLEPVIHPADALYWIERLSEYVDLFKIGKLNHDPAREKEIHWHGFGVDAIELCEKYGKKYYVKDDLARRLPEVSFTNTDTRTVTRRRAP